MFRFRHAAVLVAALAFSACSEADTATSPSGSGTRDTPVAGGPRPPGPGFPGGTSRWRRHHEHGRHHVDPSARHDRRW